MDTSKFPPSFVASHSYMVDQQLFAGSLEEYVQLVYVSYCLSCRDFNRTPDDFSTWLLQQMIDKSSYGAGGDGYP